MTARTSLTPAVIAESSTKRLLVALLTTYASVVFPMPGGPQRITEDGPARPAAPLADQAQRRARLEQMLLADDLVEGAGAHPDSQWAAGRVLLLAVFGGCGKEVGLHVLKPMPRD